MTNISKHCHHLHAKTRTAKERIDQEMTSIFIVKRKIKETKKQMNGIDTNRNHVHDKIHQLKQCSPYHQSKNKIKKDLRFSGGNFSDDQRTPDFSTFIHPRRSFRPSETAFQTA
jgi:hypothetical protein